MDGPVLGRPAPQRSELPGRVHPAGAQPELRGLPPGLPLRSAGTVLALQRSIGNRSVARHLSSTQPPVQRRIERGQGTGWGAIGWVAGGKELWKRIDDGFNTEMFAVRTQLQDLSA